MQLIGFLLCGISVLQLPEFLCEPGNNLDQTFPALIFHIKKFKSTGTNRLQFVRVSLISCTQFSTKNQSCKMLQ
jgi:hypothetical protein